MLPSPRLCPAMSVELKEGVGTKISLAFGLSCSWGAAQLSDR